MAVVVQEMVRGEWSGVCFTADPVDLALSRGLINAVPGLGEALVSGEVNPEEISMSAADGLVLRRRGGEAAEPLPGAARRRGPTMWWRLTARRDRRNTTW